MNARRWGAGLAAGTALVALSIGPAMAQDGDPQAPNPDQATVEVVPAPAGTAEAVAVQVGDLLSVSHTKASADATDNADTNSATANVIEINGTSPDSHLGGTAKGKGSKASGNIFDSGDTPLGRLALAPWAASVDGDGTSDSPRVSEGDARLAQLILVNSGVLEVNVAHSHSKATHNGMDSTGESSSDGATLSLADQIKLVVLHAEATSDGKGHSYLVSLNGNEVGSSDQANGQCTVTVPQLLTVDCLQAAGGNGTVNAIVAKAGLTPANQSATAIAAQGTSAKGTAVAAAGPEPTITNEPAPAELPASSAPAEAPGGTLPRTGAALSGLALLGVVLTGIGTVLMALRRRVGLTPIAG